MNLRDKLRNSPDGGAPDPAPADDFTLDAPAPKAAKAKGGKGKATATKRVPAAGKGLPKLDVNRRFLVIAGAAALVTSLSAVMYLNNAGSGLAEGGTKVKVLAPNADIPAGTPLNDDNTTTVEIPKAYLPKGYVTDPEKLKGHLAIAPMVANEPIIEARISAPDAKYGIAYLLKSGERAKTINVDSASGLAGLIKPGNEVDVIATIPDPNNEGRTIGTPVIQKARVIAVGSHLMGELPKVESGDDSNSNSNNGNGISSDNTVTLAVPGAKVGVLSLLEEAGKLRMVLRAAGDASVVKTPYSDDVIMSLLAGKIPVKPAAKPPQPHVVEHPVVQRPVIVHYDPPVRHEAPHPVVHHDPPPKPVVHHDPAPVHHNPPPQQPVHQPEIIRFGGSGN